MSSAVKYSAMYFDNNEQLVFYSVCKACGWEDPESYADQADCCVYECPECGSDYIVDESDYV